MSAGRAETRHDAPEATVSGGDGPEPARHGPHAGPAACGDAPDATGDDRREVTGHDVAVPDRLAAALPRLDATLRPVRDADADGVIALVGSCFDEYPGCVLDLPGLDADLVQPATSAAASATTLWVVEADGPIVAMIGAGARRADDDTVELKRLYVRASHRRRGLAQGLVALVEAHARWQGARAVDLWSDTRFADAHRLYERLGYQPTGHIRDLHDPSNTTEYHYRRRL